ncbi:MAG: HEPN domain-containing protein [Chloroflexi bacterium]|nr:HEPN domain-containing protein [Chloroflexota bacterium]
MKRGSLNHLTPEERQALDKFVKALKREGNGQILLAALFGSKARGDGDAESDVDILIVADPATKELRNSIREITPEFPHCEHVNDFLVDRAKWQDYARRKAAFWQNLQRDGVMLLRAPTLPDELTIFADFKEEGIVADHNPEIKRFIELARNAAHSAERNFDEDEYYTSFNRSYYAVFYAANAMLATQGLQRSKHSGVKSVFREKFIKTNLIEKKYSEDYEEVMKKREDSDYEVTFEPTEVEARDCVERSKRFVERIEKYLKEKKFLE